MFSVVEVEGISFPEEITLGESGLLLNGTAVRTVLGFNVYVVGLYLPERNADPEAIMAEELGGKRLHIAMLRQVSAEKFRATIQENIDSNFTDAEQEGFAPELMAFLDCFSGGSELEPGSEMILDYLPGQGMRTTVEGHDFDLIPGVEFYHAILRLWLGQPPQESVKQGLLGKGT